MNLNHRILLYFNCSVLSKFNFKFRPFRFVNPIKGANFVAPKIGEYIHDRYRSLPRKTTISLPG